MSRGGKIAQIRERIEALTFDLQTFCLNPTFAKFNEICREDAIRRNEGDDYVAWEMACRFKYGWVDGPADGSGFVKYQEQLCAKVIKNPSQSSICRILHLFFATGELKYIDLFYEMMGSLALPTVTRKYLADLFVQIKKLYNDRIVELKIARANHFDGLGLRMDVINFSYFDKDNIRKMVGEMKENEKVKK